MAATLTTSDGYLIYTVEGKIHEIPYSLLSICTLVKYTDRVSIILPSETNAHIKSFIDIYPVAGGTITTVDAIEAIIKLAQSQATTGGGATGSSTAIAEYRSPTDFTATYTSTSTLTLSGYNFQLDNGAQIVYIRQRKEDNTANVYVNGASGYAFKWDADNSVINIYKDGVLATILAVNDMYEVGINSTTKAYDLATDSQKTFQNNYPVQPISGELLNAAITGVTTSGSPLINILTASANGELLTAAISAAGSGFPTSTTVYLLVTGTGNGNALLSCATTAGGALTGSPTVIQGGSGYVSSVNNIAVTHVTVNYYPSSDGMDIGYYKDFSLYYKTNATSGSVWTTIEVTDEETPTLWFNATRAGYVSSGIQTGVTGLVHILNENGTIDFDNFQRRKVRIRAIVSVTTSGSIIYNYQLKGV